MACDSNWIVSKNISLSIQEFGGFIVVPDTVGRFLRKVNNIKSELVNFYPVCSQLTKLPAV